jgi:hypothetical protein
MTILGIVNTHMISIVTHDSTTMMEGFESHFRPSTSLWG